MFLTEAMQALIDLPHLILAPGSASWKLGLVSAPDAIPVITRGKGTGYERQASPAPKAGDPDMAC